MAICSALHREPEWGKPQLFPALKTLHSHSAEKPKTKEELKMIHKLAKPSQPRHFILHKGFTWRGCKNADSDWVDLAWNWQSAFQICSPVRLRLLIPLRISAKLWVFVNFFLEGALCSAHGPTSLLSTVEAASMSLLNVGWIMEKIWPKCVCRIMFQAKGKTQYPQYSCSVGGWDLAGVGQEKRNKARIRLWVALGWLWILDKRRRTGGKKVLA